MFGKRFSFFSRDKAAADKSRKEEQPVEQRSIEQRPNARRGISVRSMILLFMVVVVFAWMMLSDREAKRDQQNQRELYSDTFFAMDTVNNLYLYGDQPAIAEAGRAVKEKVLDLDKKLDVNDARSEISACNEAAGVQSVAISGDLFQLLSDAKTAGMLSDGEVDVTVEPLVSLWGIGTEHSRVPEAKEILDCLRLIDYKKIELQEKEGQFFAYLPDPGMAVTMGSLAKGFACDKAREILHEKKIESGMVALGGNIYVMGNKPGGSPFAIGIKDPLGGANDIIGTFQAADKIVATTGSYERFFESEGKRYHHVFDLKTGYPSDTGLLSVTIVADSGVFSDFMSTYAFIMGKDWVCENIDRFGIFPQGDTPGQADESVIFNCELVAIDSEQQVYISKGLRDSFQLREEKNFVLAEPEQQTSASEDTGVNANIYKDHVLVKTIALSADAQNVGPSFFEAADAQFEVRDGKIRFVNATCPDKTCEKCGFIDRPGQIAVCLPRRVILKIEK